MAKFKVGDRVKHRSSVTGSVADVLPSGNYYVRLDRPAFPGDDCMWDFGESELSPLTPAIPAGWTSADEPPIDDHDVRVLTKNGDGRGWYGESIFPEEAGWRIYPSPNTFNWKRAAPGEVLAWCEIEPAAKVETGWYIVTDQLFKITHAEAVELALELAKKGKASYIARVVEEVKPGKPVITKLEE